MKAQEIMYRLSGKKAVIMSLTESEKLVYPALKVGEIVMIDHRYSPESNDYYVADLQGNVLGRVSKDVLKIEKKEKLPLKVEYSFRTRKSNLIVYAKFGKAVTYYLVAWCNSISNYIVFESSKNGIEKYLNA